MATARYAKTEKGHAEIAQRLRNLRSKMRTVLFLVDPGKSLDEIRQQVAQIGAPDDALAQLVAEGYVAEVARVTPATAAAAASAAAERSGPLDEAERFRVAKAFMNDTIVDTLGIRAFLFTLKLERCATRTDLAALLEGYRDALAKKIDRADANVLVQRTRELLNAT